MTDESKKFRSKYFYSPRRTKLPEDVIKAQREKYKKIGKNTSKPKVNSVER